METISNGHSIRAKYFDANNDNYESIKVNVKGKNIEIDDELVEKFKKYIGDNLDKELINYYIDISDTPNIADNYILKRDIENCLKREIELYET